MSTDHPNQQLTDQDRDFLHTHSSCPFCGHSVEDKHLSGLNGIVCQPCSENVHLHNAAYATLFTSDGSIELWEYIATADEWKANQNENVVFLNPNVPFWGLSTETRKAIVAFANGRHRDILPRGLREEVDEKYLDIIMRDRTLKSVTTAKEQQLRAQISTPTIVTVEHIYSESIETLTETPKRKKQVTFGEL